MYIQKGKKDFINNIVLYLTLVVMVLEKKNYMTIGFLLVNKPLQSFKYLIGNVRDLHSHETTKYYIEWVLKEQNFIKTYEKTFLEVVRQIDSNHVKQMKENRNRLPLIIKSVLFLATRIYLLKITGMTDFCLDIMD